MDINKIIVGNCLELVDTLSDKSIDTIVTSPPYFKQRKYNGEISVEIGQEPTAEEYINKIQTLFKKLFEKVKDNGTLWLNLGDKYVDGELLGLPWRIALALKEIGWHLRSDIIWHKPNAMPQSTKSRPSTDHEYIFLFSKNKKYFYDADAIREPHKTFSKDSKMKGGRNHFGKDNSTPAAGKFSGYQGLHKGDWSKTFNPLGRNKRTVWSVSLSKYRGAHFAVFPEDLIKPCILAGCPDGGVVLDPFMGSGTVAVVSIKHNRNFIGIEQNAEYANLAEKRISDSQITLL